MSVSSPVLPGSIRWSELVRLGEGVVGNRNWTIGDAALEIFPMREAGSRGAGSSDSGLSFSDNLALYADEIGVAFSTIQKCRQTSSNWPVETRTVKTSWKVYSVLGLDKQHLIREGMTVTEAFKAAGHEQGVERVKSARDAELEAARAEAAAEATKVAEIKAAERAAAAKAEAEQVAAAAKARHEAELVEQARRTAEQHERQARASRLREVGSQGREAGRASALESISAAQLQVGVRPDAVVPGALVAHLDADEKRAFIDGYTEGSILGWNVLATEHRKAEFEKARAVKEAEEAIERRERDKAAKLVAAERERLQAERVAEEAARSVRSKIEEAKQTLAKHKGDLTQEDRDFIIDVVLVTASV